MSAFETFFWTGFPYLSIGLLVVGLIWRYRYDKFGWTSRSSQLYESTWLRWSSPLFHFGILFVFIGHFIGLIIPKSWTSAVGISEEVYHLIATIPGTIAGVMTVVGLAGLLVRRFKYKSVRLATSRNDVVMYVFLAIPILLGLFATLQNQVFGGGAGYDYRETISPWLRSLFILQPEVELMTAVPVSFKLHIIAGFLLLAVWPFTRLVHAFSAPVGYPTRPYVVYRSREEQIRGAETPRGWEPVNTSKGPDREKSTGA